MTFSAKVLKCTCTVENRPAAPTRMRARGANGLKCTYAVHNRPLAASGTVIA